MWQKVAKWNELLKLPRRQISLVAKSSKKANFLGCGNFQKKDKFQVNLNKGLCLLFRAEPQMNRRVCNKDAIKGQAPNLNVPTIQVSVSVQFQFFKFQLSL